MSAGVGCVQLSAMSEYSDPCMKCNQVPTWNAKMFLYQMYECTAKRYFFSLASLSRSSCAFLLTDLSQ